MEPTEREPPVVSNVEYLPIWKKGATAAERLRELAFIADKHPDWFDKWVIVYCEDNTQRLKVHWMSGEQTRTSDCLAVLSAGSMTIFEETRR